MAAQTQGAIALVEFPFSTTQIRACLIEDRAWFVARDVFTSLDIAWRGKESLLKIKEEWRGVRRFRTPQINQHGTTGEQETELLIIAEPAVYKIAFRSDKPEAERFTDRIAEIVTTIRKTGKYEATPQQTAAHLFLTPGELVAIRDAVANVARHFRFHLSAGIAQAIYAPVYAAHKIERIQDLPADKLPDALAMLKTIEHQAHAYYLEASRCEKETMNQLGQQRISK